MPETRALYFWMGGVVSQPIELLMRLALSACGQPEVNLLGAPGFADIHEKLVTGQLEAADFCRLITKMSRAAINPEDLQEAALARFAPVPGVVRAVNLVPEQYARWLIVDYPRSWFEQVHTRLQIDQCIPRDQTLFLDSLQLPRLVPDVFGAVAQRAGLRPEQCLIFDANPHRAVAALDYGFPAAVFVDANRMEREFRMRHFTAQALLEHRPATVLQRTDH